MSYEQKREQTRAREAWPTRAGQDIGDPPPRRPGDDWDDDDDDDFDDDPED